MSTEPNSPFVDDPLSAVDARILGSLVEKQATTPETYPLTLNALVLACNQKTSRDPVMNLTPGQVGQSLRQLEGRVPAQRGALRPARRPLGPRGAAAPGDRKSVV